MIIGKMLGKSIYMNMIKIISVLSLVALVLCFLTVYNFTLLSLRLNVI
jgi:hypothetical protein